jgi:hypothetical protein
MYRYLLFNQHGVIIGNVTAPTKDQAYATAQKFLQQGKCATVSDSCYKLTPKLQLA